VVDERRNPLSEVPDPAEAVLAAVEPLFEIISALVPGTRLTTISIRGDTLEVVASSGVDAFAVGAVLRSPVIAASRFTLLAEGSRLADADDSDEPEHLREPLRQLGFQRGLVAVLHSIGDVLYCVVIDRAEGALSLNDTERHVLVAAIQQARDGIDNADSRIEAARTSANLETIVHLGIALSSVLDLEVIAAQTVEYASLLLGLPAAAVLIRGEAEADFSMLASEGLPRRLSRLRVTPFEVAGLEVTEPAGFAETPAGELFEALPQRGLASTFVAPLVLQGGRAGLLLGLDRPDRQSTPEERNAFQLLAIQCATAMRSAGLYAEVIEARRLEALELARTKLLSEVTVAATSSLSLIMVADRVLAAMAKTIDIKLGAVYLLDESSRRLALLTAYGLDSSLREEIDEFVVDGDSPALVSKAISWGRIVTSEDVPMTEGRREVLGRAGLGSTQNVAIPLASSDGVVGACSFVFDRDEAFSSDELALFRSVGGILAQAIRNSQLLDRTTEAARLSDALNDANGVVHSTLDIGRVMQSALETGVDALGCEAAAIEILDGDDWIVRYQHGFSSETVGLHVSREDAPYAALAAGRGVPIAVDFTPGDHRIYAGFVNQQALKSVLAVPLMVRTEVIGCALFYSSSAVTQFADAEIDFGRKLGSAVSLSYENARLYESQHRIAETLQQALLTLPDSLPGVEYEAYYHSATESTLVGGDFYDLFELDPRRVGIIIGDIAGKGLAAAVLTSLVRNTIRAYAFEQGKLPAEIMRLTNDVVERATPSDAFATVFFGVLDREDGRLCYASAGHTRSAILRADGTTSTLDSTGPVLGAFADIGFDEAETSLGPREILFLYTDGLTEARRDGDFYGEARLFAVLGLAELSSPQDLAATVVQNVMEFAHGHLRDDLAILAVARSDRIGGTG
jgi:GAF domain-containing protein